ncbi:hypothetical protein SDC9_162238 [bioreactor metagenome]|uniref:Uncharacterized protein n=1 Tax=bioreactor metagenome TaxID=1076179 RepID=A0A645FNJ0_9ZZZZ
MLEKIIEGFCFEFAENDFDAVSGAQPQVGGDDVRFRTGEVGLAVLYLDIVAHFFQLIAGDGFDAACGRSH